MRERRRPGQQLVEQDAERVDVRARIHVERSTGGLLGSGVFQGADARVQGRVQRLVSQLLAERLGQAEVYDLGDWLAIDHFNE